MGNFCYSFFESDKNYEVFTEKTPRLELSLSSDKVIVDLNSPNAKLKKSPSTPKKIKKSESRSEILSRKSADIEAAKKKKKKKPDIKYKIEIKYSEKQIVNPGECFYIKNLSYSKNSKKVKYKPKILRFNTIIDKTTESKFHEQMKLYNDIDKVLEDFANHVNIVLRSSKEDEEEIIII